jgi:hypothetical protein
MSDLEQGTLFGLDASDVEIAFEGVYIKRVLVGKRDLTFGLFRQLVAQRLVDEEKVKLLGKLRGWVNYDPWKPDPDPNRPGEPDHRQFLARFGGQLRRCPFWVRNLDEVSSERPGVSEEAWPPPFMAMKARHESLTFCSLLDRMIQGNGNRIERRGGHHTFAFRARPPFGPFTIEVGYERTLSDEFLLDVIGSFDADPAVSEPSRQHLREFLESQGFTAGNPADHWESLIAQNVESARDYIARWNALMDKLRSVEQLYIGG